MKSSGKNIFIPALILSAVFLVCGISFIFFMGYLSKQETKKSIRQATDQTAYAVNCYINENFNALSAAAVFMGATDFLHDLQCLLTAKEALEGNNKFEAVGIRDLDGVTIWVSFNGGQYDINMENQDENFRRALSGEIGLSDPVRNISGNTNSNIYFVPIISMGMVSGVLMGADNVDKIRETVDRSLYAGHGFAHIIKDNGDYVIRSKNPDRIADNRNIFNVVPPIDKGTSNIILQNMQERKSGEFEKAMYKENRLIAYAPLDINDWYVFYVVIEDHVNAGLKRLVLGSLLIIIFAIILFFVLNFLLYRINRASRIKLERMAYVDPLTGQRNMVKFILDAKEMIKDLPDEQFAFLVCDIRRFQMINDLFGRNAGDFVIRKISEYLKESIDKHEIFGHAMSDTFLILRRHPEDLDLEDRFRRIKQRIVELANNYFHGYKFDLCCGIYLFHPREEHLSIDDMIDRANEARKKLKESGAGSGYAFYSEEMRQVKRFEAEIESSMEAALTRKEFKVYFQPKIDIQSGNTVMGMEALVRWESPEKGLISPGKFIPLFEKNGFIINLDFFIFDEACRFYREHLLGKTRTPLIMSVNASRRSILYPSFVERYNETREHYGIPGGLIELEFTESIALGDLELFRQILEMLHGNGFLCSLDDFGSGYSSLNFLMNLAVDVLKLDGRFFNSAVNDDRRENIVKSIVEMAKRLHIKTVAEGVDDEQHVHLLRRMGCSAIQGYYFSKPLNQDAFLEYLGNEGCWNGEHHT